MLILTQSHFNFFLMKFSVAYLWFDDLITEDVRNVLLLLVCKPRGAGAIGRQHRRLSSDPNHSTLPTSVASDRSHHGFFSGRLALAYCSTLYSPPNLNFDC